MNLDKKLDDAWALLVKLKAGNKCEYCGTPNTLNSHHVYSRAKRSVRWYVQNGVCLCVAHHVFDPKFAAHLTPTDFTEWIIKKRGREWYDSLRLEAHKTVKIGDFEKTLLLDYLLKEIEKAKKCL